MAFNSVFALLLQTPFEVTPLPEWLGVIETILNLLYAVSVNGYLLFILIGFMVYTTGLSDGFAKGLVVTGIGIYFVGPMFANFLASAAGLGMLSFDNATATWYGVFGLYESQLVALLIAIGDIVAAVCVLVGAILYFNPTSGDLKSRGHSLVVRALIFAPILAFLHIAPWI
ncbi:MAG: hypothetical protein ACFFEF_11005 [Candidatus Thorarchaeota archaeon]